MLYVFDKNEDLKTILTNEEPTSPIIINPRQRENLLLEHLFEFETTSETIESADIIESGFVGFFDEDEDFQLFYIYQIEDIHGDNSIRKVYSEHVFLNDLSNEIIINKRPENKSAVEALGIALEGTRWQSGNVADLGLNTTNFYYENPISAINKIREKWGGEVKTRLVLEGNKITGRFVDLLSRRGSDTSKRLEFGKDLINVKRTIQTNHIKTALIGRGKGEQLESGGYGRRITFEETVWDKSSGDPLDKPSGQNFIADSAVLEQWGMPDGSGGKRHKFGIVEFDDIEDPNTLLQVTYKAYLELSKPKALYEVSAINLEKLEGFEHEKARLGDTNFILDEVINPPIMLETRIIEVEQDPFNPYEKNMKLGNFLTLFTDTFTDIEQFKSEIGARKGIWDSPITDGDIENIIPEIVTGFEATGLFKNIMLEWNYNSSLYIANYEVYASQVQGFTPDAPNLVFRGKSSGFAFKAQTDEQWYFRVRAVNTHGISGPFSVEINASTIKAGSQDIAPLTITNALIAEKAGIDFAKIANVRITNAMIDELDATKLKAGSVIANDITFTGILQGVTGEFNGDVKINTVDGGFISIDDENYVSVKRGDAMRWAFLEPHRLWLQNAEYSKHAEYHADGLAFYKSDEAGYHWKGGLGFDGNGFTMYSWGKESMVFGNSGVELYNPGGKLFFSGDANRNFIAPYRNGEAGYRWNRELGFNFQWDNWYLEGDLEAWDSLIWAEKGFSNLGKSVAWSWWGTINAQSQVILTHNLGYYPIVVFSGTTGNLQLTYEFSGVNQIRIYNYSTGNNAYTGAVHLY